MRSKNSACHLNWLLQLWRKDQNKGTPGKEEKASRRIGG